MENSVKMENREKTVRPSVSIKDVQEILRLFYNINVDITQIVELNAYDDRNYWIKLSEYGNSDVILKVTNEADSQCLDMIDAQTNLLKYLCENGIKCPKPIPSPKGLFFSHTFQDITHVVRLFEFIPGVVLDKVPKNNQLYFDVGKGIGELNSALQHFDVTVYKNHSHKWMLEKCCSVREYLHILSDAKRKAMVENVLDKFHETVLSQRQNFKQGLIHGDYNENNIIVKKINDYDFKIEGVIDFGDVNYSFTIFDVAIAITYMLIHSGEVITGKYVLSGYKAILAVSEAEKNILSTCVQARLCQSLVNGAYAYSKDPGNEYLLSSQKTGWIILEQLYTTPDKQILKIWDDSN